MKFIPDENFSIFNTSLTFSCSHVGTCLSFSHEDKNLFVVGAENGSIFKCSMQSPAAEYIDQITGM